MSDLLRSWRECTSQRRRARTLGSVVHCRVLSETLGIQGLQTIGMCVQSMGIRQHPRTLKQQSGAFPFTSKARPFSHWKTLQGHKCATPVGWRVPLVSSRPVIDCTWNDLIRWTERRLQPMSMLARDKGNSSSKPATVKHCTSNKLVVDPQQLVPGQSASNGMPRSVSCTASDQDGAPTADLCTAAAHALLDTRVSHPRGAAATTCASRSRSRLSCATPSSDFGRLTRGS